MKSYSDFKNALGQRESGNRYNIQNKLGYMGRYQFGCPRLSDLGFTNCANRRAEFLNNPDLQESYFDKHVQDHARNLAQLIINAKAKNPNWTLSGLIAGAHLGGRGGVTNLILHNVDKADANGTKISTYVTQFSGYEIPGYDEKKNSMIQSLSQTPERV